MGIERMVSVLIVFICIYTLFAIFHKHRSLIIISGVIIFLLLKDLRFYDIFRFINWNIIFIFISFIIITEFMIQDKIALAIAENITDKISTVFISALALSLFSGLISTFLENIATVLILSPIALEISRKANVLPTPFIIGIVLMSNLQGTATLIGDPPSMILAGYMNLTFFDFFILNKKISLFFIVQAGALGGLLALALLFKKYKGIKITKIDEEKIKSTRSIIAFAFAIIWLLITSINKNLFGLGAGIGCLVISLILLFLSKKEMLKVIKKFDYETVIILMGVFVIINVVNNSGVVNLIADSIEKYLKGNILLIYFSLILISVFLSAFIDNIPFVTAMIPVGIKIAENLNIHPHLFTFAIVIGSTVGGNMTPIGASANIVGFGIIKKYDKNFSFIQFVKYGFFFTTLATLFSSVLLWIIWR